MVVAVTSGKVTETFQLKSLEGGEVTIRKMKYGEWLTRRQMVSNMLVSAKKDADFAGQMQLSNQAATEFEFKHCITNHNLEDEQNKPLDFSKPHHIQMLDPRVGQEIEKLISDMNTFDEDEDESEGKAPLKLESNSS